MPLTNVLCLPQYSKLRLIMLLKLSTKSNINESWLDDNDFNQLKIEIKSLGNSYVYGLI